jgi:hypothetical protein
VAKPNTGTGVPLKTWVAKVRRRRQDEQGRGLAGEDDTHGG